MVFDAWIRSMAVNTEYLEELLEFKSKGPKPDSFNNCL